jgi:acetoin utilization deacetylase AcuC-like enzyme
VKRHNRIKTFYTPKQVLQTDAEENYSKSPLKPKLLLEYIEKENLAAYFEITSSFEGFKEEDFLIAHNERYVKSFFKGLQPLCESNGLKWSEQFADSIRYTNASLYHAIRHSIEYPDVVCFAPVSGMHHATYDRGGSYCTMSGQVIASVKIYRELGLSGAYVDLDAHFGNSIEDSRWPVADLNNAIPIGCNINPDGKHQSYIEDLKRKLKTLEIKILSDEVHYVVFAHGADSHEWDDLGVQCTTSEWLECSEIVYSFVESVSAQMKKQLPLTLALFGGYRRDDYDSVLSLHTADLVTCLNRLSKEYIRFEPEVKNRRS